MLWKIWRNSISEKFERFHQNSGSIIWSCINCQFWLEFWSYEKFEEFNSGNVIKFEEFRSEFYGIEFRSDVYEIPCIYRDTFYSYLFVISFEIYWNWDLGRMNGRTNGQTDRGGYRSPSAGTSGLKSILFQKLFWPFTFQINCSSDLKFFEKSQPSRSKAIINHQNNFFSQ